MTSAKRRSEFGEASEMTSAKRGSTVFGETSERVRRSFGVPFSASVILYGGLARSYVCVGPAIILWYIISMLLIVYIILYRFNLPV